MPLYEFHLLDSKGEVVARIDVPLPVAERDSLALRRAALPRTLAVAGGAPNPDTDANLRVLYRAEQRMGSTAEFHRAIGFTPEDYKKTWKDAKQDPD